MKHYYLQKSITNVSIGGEISPSHGAKKIEGCSYNIKQAENKII